MAKASLLPYYLDKSVLSTHLKDSQFYLEKILEERVNALADSSTSEQSVSDSVRVLLNQNLIEFSSQAVTANALCMSRSTLIRKLKNEGTSFSKILSATRYQLSVEYAHLPVKQIIDKMGFADESAYYRAKKRWS